MDLSLNADAALRHYLPPESWNGDAQHRFIFRAENGDEEPLLARLTAVQPDVNNERFQHCVVLRPESAEAARVFITESLYYEVGRKRIEGWMTPRAARRFNWSVFEQSFNDRRYIRRISRFYLTQGEKRQVVLRIGADGWGEVLGFDEAESGQRVYDEGFIWGRDYSKSHGEKDLRFLRQSHTNFRRQIRSRWSKGDGEIQASLHWQLLDDAGRDALAYRCRNGEWSDLLRVAELVLRVRLGHVERPPSEVCQWVFAAYGEIVVPGTSVPEDDGFLQKWRAALVQVFQPDNVDLAGTMIGERPLCIWSYISGRERDRVQVEPFSQHELMESTLRLQEWANAHFPPEEAKRLLAF